jgi:hypothetical protein
MLYNTEADVYLSTENVAFIVLNEKVLKLGNNGNRFPLNFDVYFNGRDYVNGLYSTHQYVIITVHIENTKTTQEIYSIKKPHVFDKTNFKRKIHLQVEKTSDLKIRKPDVWCKYDNSEVCMVKLFLVGFKYSVFTVTFLAVLFFIVYYTLIYYYLVEYYVLN